MILFHRPVLPPLVPPHVVAVAPVWIDDLATPTADALPPRGPSTIKERGLLILAIVNPHVVRHPPPLEAPVALQPMLPARTIQQRGKKISRKRLPTRLSPADHPSPLVLDDLAVQPGQEPSERVRVHPLLIHGDAQLPFVADLPF